MSVLVEIALVILILDHMRLRLWSIPRAEAKIEQLEASAIDLKSRAIVHTKRDGVTVAHPNTASAEEVDQAIALARIQQGTIRLIPLQVIPPDEEQH